jgi:D-alanyl-lipoteichoic acid acyltransferase DltB (MBOAT superfamily)
VHFASFNFLLFFPLVVLLYFKIPNQYRWSILLAASIFFYLTFSPIYIFLIIPVVLMDYWGAIAIERTDSTRKKNLFIILVALHVFVLVGVKYEAFLANNLNGLISALGGTFTIPKSSWLAPVGISFQTLMSISYLIEVYSDRFKATRKFHIMALYLMFFPQLVAGPIERPQNTMAQFDAKHDFDYAYVTDGLRLISFGLLKKLVIADRLAIIVNTVYGNVTGFGGSQLIMATVLYAFQIYCDFAGYTDIALGLAQVFGIRLTQNFKQPYLSRSVTEFWQRWHISLSTWLRDYLYFPLARKFRAPSFRWLALLITFVISGLWHGAAWTFIVWGTIHGIYLAVELTWKNLFPHSAGKSNPENSSRIGKALQVLFTFSAVCFAWIFFRAANLTEAMYVVAQLPNGLFQLITNVSNFAVIKEQLIGMGFSATGLIIVIASLGTLILIEALQARGSVQLWQSHQPAYLRWATYYLIVGAIIFLGVYGKSQFIYFQF